MIIRFIKLIALFLFPLLLLFAGMEYCLSKVENIQSIKRKMLDQKAGALQVLIVGSSHAYYSLNPTLFDKPSMNAASPWQTLYYDTKIVLNNLSHLKKLRLVILSVDYFSLFMDFKYYDYDPAYPYRYYHFWEIDNPSVSKLNIRRYSLLSLYQPASLREIFLEMAAKKTPNIRFNVTDMNNDGFAWLNCPADTIGFENSARMTIGAWTTTRMSLKNFAGNCSYVETLLQVLQQKNIKVLIISTPVIKNIYEKYDSTYSHLKLNFLQYIKVRYSNTVITDFSQDPRFVMKDFNDPHHLDSIGATKFSKIINDEYINQMIH